MTGASPSRAPWHLWAAGIGGLLWNAYGGFDYFMSKTQGETYFRKVGMTDAQIAHYFTMPGWMTAVWAIGVWGALLGSVLLLARSKWAFEVFVASLCAFVVSLIYAYVIAPIPGAGTSMIVMNSVILLGCLFFAWYAFSQRKAGVLR
jgi:hypothetical protein